MFIQYDGTNDEQIRAAINALKPAATIETVELEDGLSFDHRFPDGQLVKDRWRIAAGQYLNAATGAVVDELPD